MNLNPVSEGQYQPILPGIIQSRLQMSEELSKNEWSVRGKLQSKELLRSWCLAFLHPVSQFVHLQQQSELWWYTG